MYIVPSIQKLANLFFILITFLCHASFSQAYHKLVSEREWAMYSELNSLRSNPSNYLRQKVSDYKTKYVESISNSPDSLSRWEKKRYAHIVNRLSWQLKKIDAVNKKGVRKNARLKTIGYDTTLQFGAEKWAKTLSTEKKFKHDPDLPEGMIELLSSRHENIESNFVHLLIDAGLKNWIKFRGHRRALLSYKIDGIAIAEAPTYITRRNKKVKLFVFRMSIADKNKIKRNKKYGKGERQIKTN